MRLHFLLAAIFVSFIRCALGAPSALAQSDKPLPKDVLLPLYQAALGDRFKPEHIDRLFAAHQLLEKYFATQEKGPRDDLLGQLDALQIDPNVLGRIVRIRLYWPDLKPGVYYVNERVGPHPVIYFVGVPEGYVRTRDWPLVIRLPDAVPFVTEPRPGPDEVAAIYTNWIKDELKEHPDAVILMPMLNLGEFYGPSYAGMNTVIQPLLHVPGRINIDPARVYLAGHSMAGAAVWNIALHYPTYFAAINPMSGGAPAAFQKLRLPNLRNTLCVVWHDADDQTVQVHYSRDLVKLLKQYKYDVDYEETQHLGHAPPEDLLKREYTKLRSRTRELYPRQVVMASNRADAIFNRNDWVQVYQMLSAGPDQKLMLRHGTGMLVVSQNSYALSATFTQPNRIEVKCNNVESMRFFLNDQMIDFSKPVTILVNGVVRFQKKVEPSIKTMLVDQVFMGRGWRYYTAYADIDFGAMDFDKPARKTDTPGGKIEYTPPK